MSKVRQRIIGGYTFLSALFSCILFGIIPVQAASTANAVSDIMNSDRFTGAIESIEWLTTRVDHWFTMIITATAFFIISAAMLKNTCAGAYCANPKFWNKVAEAHEKAEAVQLSSLFQGEFKQKFANLSTSSIKDALLCIVPNIKAFTEFDDADIEPKQYFMKAIPQMCACIIVGVFIYNGYYRDTAAVVGNFGSEICTRFFGSIDAANWVDKLTQTTSKAESVFDNDESLEGQYCKELTQALYKAYIGVAENVTTKDSKADLMRNCEVAAQSIVTDKTHTTDGSIKDLLCAESRRWDYSMSNLHITLVSNTTASGDSGLHRNDLDPQTHTKYSYYGYFSKPGGESGVPLVDMSHAGRFYVSFVMNGHEKSGKTGQSVNIATGSKRLISPVTLTASVDVSNTRSITSPASHVKNQIEGAIKEHVIKYCKEELGYNNPSVGNITYSELLGTDGGNLSSEKMPAGETSKKYNITATAKGITYLSNGVSVKANDLDVPLNLTLEKSN